MGAIKLGRSDMVRSSFWVGLPGLAGHSAPPAPWMSPPSWLRGVLVRRSRRRGARRPDPWSTASPDKVRALEPLPTGTRIGATAPLDGPHSIISRAEFGRDFRVCSSSTGRPLHKAFCNKRLWWHKPGISDETQPQTWCTAYSSRLCPLRARLGPSDPAGSPLSPGDLATNSDFLKDWPSLPASRDPLWCRDLHGWQRAGQEALLHVW